MVRPSGWRSSEPTPVPSISGSALNSAAAVVIRIGRKRSRQAWKMASRGDLPAWRSASSAKSIIMIAFFFTMPISRMMPITAMMPSWSPARISAASAPTVAVGSVERIVTGWM